jgi:hypothetical protein
MYTLDTYCPFYRPPFFHDLLKEKKGRWLGAGQVVQGHNGVLCAMCYIQKLKAKTEKQQKQKPLILFVCLGPNWSRKKLVCWGWYRGGRRLHV